MSFIGDYSEKATWSEEGLKACNKLLSRIWNLQELVVNEEVKDLNFIVNSTIKKVTNDIDNTKFNTAISSIMILVNEMYKVGKLSREDYKNLILIISPFAPHIANELYEVMGYGENIENEKWPVADEKAMVLNEIEIPVQINGKMRGVVKVSTEITESELVDVVKSNEDISKHLTENIVKVIYVPKKILNIICK
jgi:leucyl-tRNA synthetase